MPQILHHLAHVAQDAVNVNPSPMRVALQIVPEHPAKNRLQNEVSLAVDGVMIEV